MPRGSSLILLPAFSSAGDGFSHLLFSSPPSVFFSSSQLYPVVASSWKRRRDPPRGAMGGRRGGWWGLYASGGYTPSFSFSHSGHISQDPPPLATIALCKEERKDPPPGKHAVPAWDMERGRGRHYLVPSQSPNPRILRYFLLRGRQEGEETFFVIYTGLCSQVPTCRMKFCGTGWLKTIFYILLFLSLI